MFKFFSRLGTILVVSAIAASPAFADRATELGDKMLAMLGGAEVWQEAVAVHNTAINHHPQARLPYIQEYWYFTGMPRHVVKINNHDMQRMRSYTQAGGWSLVEGDVRDFSEERLAQEIISWHRSFYRKIVLLATESADLTLSLGAGGSVEFHDSDQFIGWIEISDDGTPRRHGGSENRRIYTEFAELISFGEINWPSGGRDETGWRFQMLSIELLEEEPALSTEPPD
ncbi:MAG: hypothetical protein AAFX56_06410 [Pseudomonadota bacterium]